MSKSTKTGWAQWHDESEPLRIGVSSCLLGERVRFDGGHTRDRFVSDTLGKWVEWVPVCPEVELGMGVPRATIHLERSDTGNRLIQPKTGVDFTERMNDFADEKIRQLRDLGLDGYILKKGSPSCGMERMAVYSDGQRIHRRGVGLFASMLMEQWCQLPIEEEGRLNDHGLRENFIERILCRNRWRLVRRAGLTRSLLVEFHTAHPIPRG